MRRHPVDSTSVHSVGYDPDAMALEVEFVGGGVYRYLGVPEFSYRRLLTADSVGAYVNSVIKPQFDCETVEPG